METSKNKTCRLCLNSDGDDGLGGGVITLEASDIGKVKAIIPELVLDFPSDASICSNCKNNVDKSFELKRTFSKNNELIQSEKSKSQSEKIDLINIAGGQGSKVCIICFQRSDGEFKSINGENEDDVNQALAFCVPECDLNIIEKPVICLPCNDTLHEMYNFKKGSLSADEKIQSQNSSSEQVDPSIVRPEDENDFLSAFEVQDEEGTDIFDNIPQSTTESTKRPALEDSNESNPKRQRMEGEITDSILPPFNFKSILARNPFGMDVTLEEWLARVEEYKQKFKWSDYTTIHKVLIKLKDMKELYVWFSNIADIMNWEQWKQKLLCAFPRGNDYFTYIRKMVSRRKRKDETYVFYYYDKLKLLEPLNLTSQEQVSCIFGGITNVLVSCIGRVGDYKTPEEVLDYFKSCDDKQIVEQAENEKAAADDTEKGKRPRSQGATAANKARVETGKKPCFHCGKFGHVAFSCNVPRTGAQVSRVNRSRPDNVPKSTPEATKRPKKRPVKKKCLVCGKGGHVAEHCRNPKQITAPPTATESPNKPEWPAKVAQQTAPKPAPPRKQRQPKDPQDNWSRCRDCGKFGSKLSPCCASRVANNGSYLGAYSAAGRNREICLRCYRMGHATKDCQQFGRRNFRN